MLNRMLAGGSLAALTAAALLSSREAEARVLPVVKPSMECQKLAGMEVAPPGEAPARLETARLVTQDVVAPYCEVKGYVAPHVKFELRLPTQNWMQRLMFVGCGGFCGRIDFRIRAAEAFEAVTNGEFVLVTSDLGHSTADQRDATWAAANPQARADYGYRGVHVVTATAKAVISRFYGQPQAYSYFNGCSDGGREAMMTVQRFPADFNGVLAGAAVINDTINNSIFHAWSTQRLQDRSGQPVFAERELAILHEAALTACDTVGDGVKDGVIGDPAACRFDPGVVECKDGQAENCLSPAKIVAVRELYSGPLDARGRPIYYGRAVGSELSWGVSVATFPENFIKYMTTDHPQPYDLWSVSTAPEKLAIYNSQASVLNAMNPDISAFHRAGGKLIMWHGFGDSAVPPQSSIDYYNAVRQKLGPATDSFMTLFMFPGMGHCGFGEGPDRANLLGPLIDWVEDGRAPESVIASRVTYGRTIQTRPVYSYPAVARYRGAGDAMTADSFVKSPQ